MGNQIGSEKKGYVVIAIPGTRDENKPLPQWSFRHFEKKKAALEAAEQFVEQQEGFEAYVIRAEAYLYNPFKPKQ